MFEGKSPVNQSYTDTSADTDSMAQLMAPAKTCLYKTICNQDLTTKIYPPI